MSGSQRLVGTYLLGLEPILVSAVDGKIPVRIEGVPEELAAGLVGIWDVHMATRRRFNPDVERTLTIEPEHKPKVEVRGPEGFLHGYEPALLDAGIYLER